MAEAFFHREQDIGVAPRLDMDQPVGVKPSEMKRRSEEVAPAQAPEDRPFGPGENAREKDRRARVVGKFGAARDFMERARGEPPSRQARIDRVEFKRDDAMTRAYALDSRNFGAKIGENGGLAHISINLGNMNCSLFVP